MKKILVLAYAISPTRGSEYSVAWNYVINMSKDNMLVVLYGMSGNHMGEIAEIEDFIRINPLPNVRFVAIKPNRIARLINTLNRNNILVYTFYIAYKYWHKQVYNKAKELLKEENFDLIHFLGPIGYREPGYLWKLKLPYIWGPIGGTSNVSNKLIKSLPFAGKLKLGFRALANNIQLKCNNRIKKAIQSADVLMTATTENQINIKKYFGVDSIYLPENGIVGNIDAINKKYDVLNHLNIIWIGSIDERKALITLLRALLRVKNIKKVNLKVVGEGPLKEELQLFAINNNINEYIDWVGSVKRTAVMELLSQSDLHIITSVSEANTTVIWEAMSVGVPTMSLDHCGMHDTICEKCGIKIKIDNYEQVVDDLANQIDFLIDNPDTIIKLNAGVVECAKLYTWDTRGVFFNNIYDLAIKNWKNKRV
ncbi:glycosyltransferase family 4 protein [Flavobacterium ovatum]|uniref:glycosyltransferase family 4 protein n=1 Tax=Flavobacterium ovatum TaxID=1928857 RepID=UPI00344F8D58